jgi:hypothetical protein
MTSAMRQENRPNAMAMIENRTGPRDIAWERPLGEPPTETRNLRHPANGSEVAVESLEIDDVFSYAWPHLTFRRDFPP